MPTISISIKNVPFDFSYERTKTGNISTIKVRHHYDELEVYIPKSYSFTYDEAQNIQVTPMVSAGNVKEIVEEEILKAEGIYK